MLAYSSIAHAGYLLVGLVAANSAGKAAILFYLVAYAHHEPRRVRRPGRALDERSSARRRAGVRGVVARAAGLAALLTVFLLSLGGFPPTVGFIAKWYIFSAAVQEGLIALAVIGVLTSVIAVFFYLRIVVLMYMSDETAPGNRPRVPSVALAGMLLALVGVFYLGVLPGGTAIARGRLSEIYFLTADIAPSGNRAI